MRRAPLVLLLVIACGHDPPGPVLAGATDLGPLGDAAAPTLLRDGGSSVLLGGRILWSFGDTLFPFRSVDGAQLRTNTAALADPVSPLALSEPLDADGAPAQFVPFTADEVAENARIGPGQRIALWPGEMVPLGDGSALVLVDKLIVRSAALDYQGLSTELAQARAGSTSATRLGPLFSAPEPLFNHGAVARGGLLHLFSCETSGRCRVARAPLAEATRRAAWTFWAGGGWSTDLARATLDVPGSTAGFSVAWNDALNRYVSASSPGFSNQVLLRTAPAPEGPWSDATVAFRAPSNIYAVYQHPELQLQGGQRIRVGYSRSTGQLSGEIRLIELAFQ